MQPPTGLADYAPLIRPTGYEGARVITPENSSSGWPSLGSTSPTARTNSALDKSWGQGHTRDRKLRGRPHFTPTPEEDRDAVRAS